jgi:hypothetical protein
MNWWFESKNIFSFPYIIHRKINYINKVQTIEIQSHCRWQECGFLVPKNFATICKGDKLFVGILIFSSNMNMLK